MTNKPLVFEDIHEFSSEVSMLKCPRCGSDYLHHGTVEIFNRAEDANITAVTTVDIDPGLCHVNLPSVDVDNPSMRRHGLTISFDCEECGGDIELTIAQHKGSTHVGWRFEAEKEN